MISASPTDIATIAKFQGISAADLMKMEFPEPKWAIPGVLPEGLSILGGKPKKGKSIFALNIGLAIASGGLALGKIPVEQGTVIYYALEDSHRRLKKRIGQMLQGRQVPEKLILFNHLERIDKGGLRRMESEITKHDDTRLIVIDTLVKFRAPGSKSKSLYDDEYQQMDEIKALADKYFIPILLIHHMSKKDSDDIMDLFSGTLGLTGAADTLLAIQTEAGAGASYAALHITGRDVEADSQVIELDKAALTWKLGGQVSEMSATHKQQEVINAIKNAPGPVSPTEIATATAFDVQYVKNLLPKLLDEGTIRKRDRGEYEFNGYT